MTTIPMEYSLMLAGILFALGIFGLLFRHNLIFILLALELMLNACGLAFVAIGSSLNQADGQVMFLVILAVSAAEVALGLALAIKYEQRFGTLELDQGSERG